MCLGSKTSGKKQTRSKTALQVKRLLRKSRQEFMKHVCNILYEEYCRNKNKISHNMYKKIIQENKETYPTLNKHMISMAFCRFLRRKQQTLIISIENEEGETQQLPPHSTATNNPLSDSSSDVIRKKGGRPKGSSIWSKKHLQQCILAAKNEIALKYSTEKSKNKKLEKYFLRSIIQDISKKHNLPADVKISDKCIMMRLRHKKIFIANGYGRGLSSPLLPIEPTIVKLITQMATIRQCLNSAQGLQLVNDLIKGTEYEEKLVKFKSKFSNNVLPIVGLSYWNGFMRRNGDRIVSKTGKKSDLNRDNWTYYGNFNKMYEHIIEELVSANLAIQLEEPKWMDANGREVPPTELLGCKVTHKITKPEWCIVADEVGSDLSMKGDGRVGGQKFMCGRGNEPYNKSSNRSKHFTCLGLTLLTGEPLMCVVIFAGKTPKAEVEFGLDPFVDIIGEKTDQNYIKTTVGKVKYSRWDLPAPIEG